MSEKRTEFISFEEFQKLYKAEKDNTMKLCMLLGFGSGLRISEIVGFRRKFKFKGGIRLEEKSAIPPLTKDKIELAAHQIRIDEAKGGKWRTTVTAPLLNEKLIDLLPVKIPRRTIPIG